MYVIVNFKGQEVVMPEAEAAARRLPHDSWRFLSCEDALHRAPFAQIIVIRQLEAENTALKTRLLATESLLRIEKLQHDAVMENLREANVEIARMRKAEQGRIEAMNRVRRGDRWVRNSPPLTPPRTQGGEQSSPLTPTQGGEQGDVESKILIIAPGGKESIERVQKRAAMVETAAQRKQELIEASDAEVEAKLVALREQQKRARSAKHERGDMSHIGFLTSGGLTPEGA